MPELVVDQPSISLALIGGYISIFGLGTYFVKEKLYLSEPLLAVVFGIIIGPQALNWFRPHEWIESEGASNELTFQAVRIVIGIQVLFAGIALPKAYLRKEWKSVAMLILPIMTCAWLVSSLLIWAFFPGLKFLEALIIGSCVTPTDPVLANSITKGRFADKHVPKHVRNIIVAESGANDGLGFPFLFLALYLLLYKHTDYEEVSTLGGAMGKWFYEIWAYQILLSVVEGAVIGTLARVTLKYARARLWIDHESFLAYGIALTFLTLGVIGMLGGDDLLCCFIVGNAFTWDDSYRLETEDDTFQDVIDTLLNVAIFTYIGAIMPWDELTNAEYGLEPWRFVVCAILILLLRRPPFVIAFTKFTPVFQTYRESAFSGWFGPIGVSAVYYIEVALRNLPDDAELQRVRHSIGPIVYFIIFASIFVHGWTIPVFKLSTRTWTIRSSAPTVGSEKFRTTGPSTLSVTEVPTTAVSDEGATVQASAEDEVVMDKARLAEGERAYTEGDQVVIESADEGEGGMRVVSKGEFERVNGGVPASG